MTATAIEIFFFFLGGIEYRGNAIGLQKSAWTGPDTVLLIVFIYLYTVIRFLYFWPFLLTLLRNGTDQLFFLLVHSLYVRFLYVRFL